MPTYKTILSYIGTPYNGFQSQPDKNAVQDHLEKAFTVFFREPIKIKGASRTDRGVHAEGQVATFSTSQPFHMKRWILGLNAILPKEIGLLSIEEVDESYHPITQAQAKAYRYRIWEGHCYHPLVKPYVWAVQPSLSRAIMAEEARDLIGHHDFTSFCNSDSDVKTKDRRILDIQVQSSGPLINIWVLGDGFLKQMVRIIAGTLVYAARGQIPRSQIPGFLALKDRSSLPPTAPPEGLSLVKIFYDGMPPSLDQTIEENNRGFGFGV